MPHFERNLLQAATWWAQTAVDQYGKPTFAAPVGVMCRWEDSSEIVINKKGQEQVIRSKVFLAGDTPVGEQGYLYLGESLASDPRSLGNAYEVMGIKRTPDLKNLRQLVVAFL